VLAVVIALLCVSTAFIVLRLVSRFGIVKRVSKDDYAIIVAWVSTMKTLELCSYNTGLIEISSSHSGSPSLSVMGQALDSAVTKQTLIWKIMCFSRKPNMPSPFATYVLQAYGCKYVANENRTLH